MQVSLETTEELEKKLIISVPESEIIEKMQAKIMELAKTMRIDGFRPGKVPASVIEKRFKPSIRLEVLESVINQSLQTAFQEKELRPVSTPKIDVVKDEEGQPFEFTALFEIYPEVILSDYTQLKIESVSCEVTDADVEKRLENMRKQKVEWRSIDAPAEQGNQVIIDFNGEMDGKPLERGSSQDHKLELGSGAMISGFEEGLIGAKAGETRELNLSFPTGYHEDAIAGKPVKFTVKVKSVEAGQVPELNDALAELFKVDEGGLTELRSRVRNQLISEIKEKSEVINRENLFSAIRASTPVILPKAMIDQEAEAMKIEAMEHIFGSEYSKKLNLNQLPNRYILKQAATRVHSGVIFAKLAKEYALKANPAKVRNMIENIAKNYQDADQVVNWYYRNEEQLKKVEHILIEQELMEMLFAQAQVTDKKVTFAELNKLMKDVHDFEELAEHREDEHMYGDHHAHVCEHEHEHEYEHQHEHEHEHEHKHKHKE